MAKNSIRDFSSTAGSNTDIQSVDIDENCAASGLNNAIRELMADIADFNSGTVGIDVLSLADDDNSAQIKFQAPSAVTTTTTFTLPDGDGSANQYLQTDGSGTLSWSSVTSSGAYDLNGGELTLDADGDTTIHADTDDEIDFKVAGTDVAAVTSNGVLSATFRSLVSADDALTFGASESSSTLKVRGNLQIIIDSNNNSTNKAFYVAKDSGSNIMKLQENGQLFLDGEGGSDLKVDVRQGSSKMWCNFDGTGTIHTNDAYNVSSLTDSGTGVYKVHINNDMNNVNHAPTFGNYTGSYTANSATIQPGFTNNAKYSGEVRMSVSTFKAAYYDLDNLCLATHGDLA